MAKELLVDGLEDCNRLIPLKTPTMLTDFTPEQGYVFTTCNTSTGQLLNFSFEADKNLQNIRSIGFKLACTIYETYTDHTAEN